MKYISTAAFHINNTVEITRLSVCFKENLSDHKGHILQTCAGCLLWTDSFRNGDVTGRYIMQLSEFCPPQFRLGFQLELLIWKKKKNLPFLSARTGKIDPKDVEIFKQQAECLKFPENFHSYDGKTGQ